MTSSLGNRMLGWTAALAISVAGVTTAGGSAHSAAIVIDSAADDDGAGCTLREALASANGDADLANGCVVGSGADTLTFTAAVTGTIALASALPEVTGDVTITGPGAASLTISGELSARVFKVGAAASLHLSALTVANGFADQGAGIQSAGALVVDACVFTDNLAEGQSGAESAYGGAIQATSGSISIANSRFTGNEASSAYKGAGDGGVGGAIYIGGATTGTIERCLFKDNKAKGADGTTATINRGGDAAGGAVAIGGSAAITVRYGTFSDNEVMGGPSGDANQWAGGDAFGGGLSTGGTSVVVLDHCTFANNTVTAGSANGGSADGQMGGAGIRTNGTGSLTLRSSLLEGNFDSALNEDDCDATTAITSNGYNVVTSAESADCLGTALATDQTATATQLAAFDDVNFVLPLLAPAANVGLGIDAGSCVNAGAVPYLTDATGASIPNGNGCDVGAAEATSSVDLAIDQGDPSVYMGASDGAITVVVTVTNSTGTDAHDVVVIAEIPTTPALTFDNGASSAACVPDGMGYVECTLGTVTDGSTPSVNLIYTVPQGTTADFDHEIIVLLREEDGNSANDEATKNVDVQSCGDSAKNGAEACDDGDAGGDGCSDTCVLESGYTCPAAGGDCTDIDECTAALDDCDANATCQNTAGSFTCTCNANFTGDGTTCECETGFFGVSCTSSCPGFDGNDANTICGGHGTCAEGVAGSGECSCDSGWYLDATALPLPLSTGAGICDETYCGDGTTTGSEVCDDGNENNDDACPSGGASAHLGACVQASCGDGFVRTDVSETNDPLYESCDDGANNAQTPNSCRTNCALPRCGDGIIDDSAPYGEGCDDSNTNDDDACPSGGVGLCQAAAVCGDGIVQTGVEGCDDGDGDNYDGCPDGQNGSCQPALCGDGFVNRTGDAAGPEACDDIDPTAITAAIDGDGCTTSCELEAGYTCTGLMQTQCAAECGSLFDFAVLDGDWADAGGALTFGYGTTTGGDTGWETGLNAALPAATATGALQRILAVPAASDATAPKLALTLDLDIDETGGSDCVDVYITTIPAVLGVDTPQVSLCTNGLDLTLQTPALTAFAGQNVYATIALNLGNSSANRNGLSLYGATLVSDVDGDGNYDFKSLACGDSCVDADEDDYGDVTSQNLSTCPNATVDCNDGNADAKPGNVEVCNNAFDDDCNGDIDALDAYCAEDCGDGVDNGGNGLTDCEDAACDGTAFGVTGPDAFCASGCLRHWNFDSGPSFTQHPVGGLWEHSAGNWTSSGVTLGLTARQTSRITMTTALGSRTLAGPEPTLELTFSHSGAANRRDLLGVCINNTSCQGNDPNLVLLADSPSPGTQTKTIDLAPWVGDPTIAITVLFDSTGSAPYPTVDGVVVTDVRIFSDIDNDLSFEGGDGDVSCDQCWDSDGDFYGDADSPDLTTCLAFGGNTNSPISDCDDSRFAVTPANASETNCGDGIDNDCDGFTDAFDSDCGSEDCANLLDDNVDGNTDCADPTCANSLACSTCLIGFDFTKGVDGGADGSGASAGFDVTGKVDSTPEVIWQWTDSSGDGGWATRKGVVADAGSGRVRGWLKRTVVVPATMPQPELELLFTLAGDGSDDTIGVCFDTASSACSTSQAINVAWSTATNTAGDGIATVPVKGETNALTNVLYHDGTYDHAIVEIPSSTTSIVIFYDTKNGANNTNAGAFVAEMRIRSDIDLDYEGCTVGDPSCGAELFGQNCDSCIDIDGDGFGATQYSVSDLSNCPAADSIDCDDNDPATHPDQNETCYGGGLPTDNDCNGVLDNNDSECIECGNGHIEGSETCDDGNQADGDGCSSACQVEAGALYISELHLPVLHGSNAEQWVELYNDSPLALNLRQIALELSNSAGDKVSFGIGDSDGCTVLQTAEIQPGAYYVIALGAAQDADFSDITNIDASCTGMNLSANGDVLRLENSNSALVDAVDFTGWACQLGQVNASVGGQIKARSIVLKDPENSNQNLNDNASAWCMAGGGNVYSASGAHLGAPRQLGGVVCAELLCDGVDDDCDGVVDETQTAGAGFESELSDSDGDEICDAQDCDPNSSRCSFTLADSLCDDDADGDGIIDCIDTCNDSDGDFYGSPPAGAVNSCVGFEDLTCDNNPFEFPGNVEYDSSAPLPGFRCINGQDDNCDGSDDCLDAACGTESICAGEICDTASSIACGDVVTAIALSSDFPACLAGVAQDGKDKVYQYTATGSGDVTLRLQNLGTKLYMLQVSEGSCVHEDCGTEGGCCGDFQWTAESTCVAGGMLTFPVTADTDYYIVAKQVGECAQGSGVAASLTVACSEVCDGAGIDEDADGHTDCDDDSCVATAGCATADWDNDGVPNGWEITCPAGDPLQPGQNLDDDDYQDYDDDLELNCVDVDDDGDGASDALEEAQCAAPTSKNDDAHHPAQDICVLGACGDAADLNCDQANIDADCNGLFDTTEADCGVKEGNCGDGLDNDADGDTDCADDNCVADAFCSDYDHDNDNFTNEIELYCNTDPTLAADKPTPPQIANDEDNDGVPNCADEDDDGDGHSDIEELICGSNPLVNSDVPVNSDDDPQCDAVDPDDDNDSFGDSFEEQCLSSTTDPSSTPMDQLHDADQDGTCNEQDADDDNDGWFDTVEAACDTDPLDGTNNPTANGQDLDDDKVCDKVDNDDDGDGWLDIDEQTCGFDAADANSVPVDTDNDTLCDAVDTDDDADGVADDVEILCNTDPLDGAAFPLEIDAIDTDLDGVANCVDDDDDDDGLTDALEELLGTLPLDKDTDDDGLDDGVEDSNHNGMVDANETSPLRRHTDVDGLPDGDEAASCYALPQGGCAPTLGWMSDTDEDGRVDGAEDANGNGMVDDGETNPLLADTDEDGVSDGEEFLCQSDGLDPNSVPVDNDGNGECDGKQIDSDSDGVADGVEIYCGTGAFDSEETPSLDDDLEDDDDDGELNCRDLDDDNDGVLDVDEEACLGDRRDPSVIPTTDDIGDYDSDGLLNCIDTDDDNDGLSDADEALAQTDPKDRDSDDDGLSDGLEKNTVGTDPTEWDTDMDGISDGTEYGITVPTVDTAPAKWQPDEDPTFTTDPLEEDSDGDQLLDGEEDANHNGRVDDGEGNPLDKTDGLLDTDSDGVVDREELVAGTDINNPDTDGDELDDQLELHVHHTDPLNKDTDGGGIIDGWEVRNGTDPKIGDDDFATATVEGQNVFSCSGGEGTGALALVLAFALGLMWRRRQRLS